MLNILLKLLRIDALAATLQTVFQSGIKHRKMDFCTKFLDVLASIVLMIIVSFIILMMLLFLGFGLSFYLNNILLSNYQGFVIIGFIFLVSARIMFLNLCAGYLQRMVVATMMRICRINSDQYIIKI